MSDLIQRLKDHAEWEVGHDEDAQKLCLEAAAEIERERKLRVQLSDDSQKHLDRALAAERQRDEDRARFKECVDDMFDGMECDPECDSYGHTETCCSTNGTEAVKKLRRQRDEAIAALRELVRLKDVHDRLEVLNESSDPKGVQRHWLSCDYKVNKPIAWESARRLLNQKEGT